MDLAQFVKHLKSEEARSTLVKNHGIIIVTGEFNKEMGYEVCQLIHYAKGLGRSEITLIIDSHGGSVNALAMIRNSLFFSKLHITTLVLNLAGSAGANLLMVGDVRLATPHASVMFHHGSFTKLGVQYVFVEEYAKYLIDNTKIEEQGQIELLTNRTKLDEKAARMLLLSEFPISARYALELGIIDQIVDADHPALHGLREYISSGTKSEK